MKLWFGIAGICLWAILSLSACESNTSNNVTVSGGGASSGTSTTVENPPQQ